MRPGDRVRCIRGYKDLLITGNPYTVKDFNPTYPDEIYLKESTPAGSWYANRFVIDKENLFDSLYERMI